MRFFSMLVIVLVSGSIPMSEINNKYKNADGFVYIKYTGENCFG